MGRSAATAVLIVVALTVVGVAGWALLRDQATADDAPQAQHVAVIGDSLSAGVDNDAVWPSIIAATSSASIFNLSVPAAGYMVPPREYASLAAQVERAQAAKPDVVVVFAGHFDVGQSEDLIRQAATDVYGSLVRTLPAARVVVLGPLWYEDPAPESVVMVDRALAAAADAVAVPYVSMINQTWLTGPDLIRAGDSLPTDAGQRLLAGELAGILRENGVDLG